MSAATATLLVASLAYLVMLIGYWQARRRALHIPIMVSLILFDLAMPVYLFLNRDWYQRLIEHGDIATFGPWVHFMPVMALYVLYAVQVYTAVKLLKNRHDSEARGDHRMQAKGILWVRGAVLLTGALMIVPEADES